MRESQSSNGNAKLCDPDYSEGSMLQTEEITIHVDPDAAKSYRDAPEEERRKLDLLLSMRLKDAVRPGRSLRQVMSELSQKAQSRGMTPAILESILHDS